MFEDKKMKGLLLLSELIYLTPPPISALFLEILQFCNYISEFSMKIPPPYSYAKLL